MNKIVVIYRSVYGYTKTYAEMIAEELNCDIREYSDEYNPNVLILEELRLVEGVEVAVAIKTYPDGKVTGTGAQSPISIGKTIAELYYKWKAGETVEARYPIATFMINSDNIAEYNNGGWQ